MYDIQSALRRRAMAERLEALSRAAEATERAETAERSTEVTEHPISATEPEAVPAQPPAAPSQHAPRPSPEPFSRPRHLAEPQPAWPTATTRDRTPAQRRVSPQPSVPLAPPRTPAPSASDDLTPPATSAVQPLYDEPSRRESLVPVQAPDQTARLEVPTARPNPAVPPPLRRPDPSVPPGVTLLRDDLGLRDNLGLRASEAPSPGDAPPLPGARVLAEPRPGQPVPDVALDDPSRAAGPTESGALGLGEQAQNSMESQEGTGEEEGEPQPGSSATAIADMLRHGSSGLFFRSNHP